MASIIPANPIIDPIDKSNSPPIINSAAPTEIMPRNAATVAQLTIPSALKLPEWPAVTRKQRRTRTAPEIEPNSGRDRKRRNAPISRTRSSEDGAAAGDVLAVDVEMSGPIMTASRKRQRYWPANFSTLAMLSFVTNPGPDEMWRGHVGR